MDPKDQPDTSEGAGSRLVLRMTYSSRGRYAATIRDRETDRQRAQTAWFPTREEAQQAGRELLAQMEAD